MNNKIIVAAAVTAIVAGSAVVYVQASTVTNNTYQPAPAAPKAVHPLDRGDVKDANLDPFKGPNNPLKVLEYEENYLQQIKRMNASGEYMNKMALVMILHAMTHQKIKTDKIGFSFQMTPETIDVMLENIKNSKAISDQERADFLTIVENWKAGDFSQADKDHNYFWTLQGGTIGKATGINSAAEEAAFVASHFKDGKMTSVDQ
jgi:hypothetical protein